MKFYSIQYSIRKGLRPRKGFAESCGVNLKAAMARLRIFLNALFGANVEFPGAWHRVHRCPGNAQFHKRK